MILESCTLSYTCTLALTGSSCIDANMLLFPILSDVVSNKAYINVLAWTEFTTAHFTELTVEYYGDNNVQSIITAFS